MLFGTSVDLTPGPNPLVVSADDALGRSNAGTATATLQREEETTPLFLGEWVPQVCGGDARGARAGAGLVAALHPSEGVPGLYSPGNGVQIGVHYDVTIKTETRRLLPVPPFVGEHAMQDRAEAPGMIQEGTVDLLR